MKTKLAGAAMIIALGLGLGSGCVFSIGGDGDSHAHRHESSKSAPPVVVMPANTEDGATFAEIDAAGRLSFDEPKVTALKNVAARPTLSPPAQVHLVDAALRTVSFEEGKVSILLTLAENPAFCPAAREAIFRQLDRLNFEGSKTRVMSAIQQKSASAR